MAKVVPAINVHNLDAYRQAIKLVRQLSDRYQLDVIDPDFADNETVDLSELEPARDLKCDVHIMSPRPAGYLPAVYKLYPHMVIIQFEGVEDLEQVLDGLAEHEIPAGIAINPDTSIEDIASLLPKLTHVLIMAYPAGFSGQKLQPSVLKKVEQLRALQPKLEVGLDGGVAEDTLTKIAKAKFDVVNVTTYLFNAEQPLDRYSELMEALA